MDPVIKGELTPVTIDDKGTVKKADLNEPWYSYSNKEWANSVILQNSYDSLSAYGNIHGGATLSNDHVTLDGQDDYIDLGLAKYDFKDGITMAIKLKANDLSKQQDTFGNWEGAGGGCGFTQARVFCNLYIEQNYVYVGYQNDIHLMTDYIVIFTYDNNTLKLYVNGQKVDEREQKGNAKPSPASIFIGANPDPINDYSTNYSNIDVYQAAIFDRAITDEEISKMKDDIKITNSEGLLKYVDFTNKRSEDYEPKEVIPEDVIESYFVWIPKYRYQLFNLGVYTGTTNLGNITSSASVPNNNQEIKIKFGDYNTEDGYKECKTVTTSDNGNCHIGDYMTHPAFTTFENSTGFWVGKFETGYLGATTKEEAQNTSNTNKQDTSKIIIRPNVYSWRNIQVANAHLSSFNYERSLDSHMMKNSEWGAVAYLTNSKYGRCNGINCEEVRINNNQNYITGYSAKNTPICGQTGTKEECNKYEGTELRKDGNDTYNYFNSSSVVSSTTRNYSGIYDMSGGSWEYVMGVIHSKDNTTSTTGPNASSNSGFNGSYSNSDGKKTDGLEWPPSKYYDLYDYNTSNREYQRGHLGDATKEMGPFYSVSYLSNGVVRLVGNYYADVAFFVNSSSPWFSRGGSINAGTDAGVNAFHDDFGLTYDNYTFRIILTPIKE